MIEWLPRGRLGRQIAFAVTGFTTLVTLTLGYSLQGALHNIEQRILDDTLISELAHFRGDYVVDREPGDYSSYSTVIYSAPARSVQELPSHLQSLSVGRHDIINRGRDYRVLVEELDGVRYVVQFDDTDIHVREQAFFRSVWTSAAVILLLSLVFGGWVARRLSRPTQQLSEQIRDLGERPDAEIDLSRYKDDEIGFLAQRLKAHHEQLTELIAREQEFAGNVSHELRTPVTTISLAAEVLAIKKDLSAKDAERIDRIQRATKEMSELVETFLVLAQAAGEPNETSACDVTAVVEDVVQQQRVWLGDKPVDVIIQRDSELAVAAPARVVSVLISNLVRNAFRYTSVGSVIITLNAAQVVVEDTGVGIDVDTEARMFERHTRGRHGDTDGAGLGLSIVRRICERYGWEVLYQAPAHQGSCFILDFGNKGSGLSADQTSD